MNNRLQEKPLGITERGEREHRMAALALPFGNVETNITHVTSGVTVGQTLKDVTKWLQHFVLTFAFIHTADVQLDLVNHLRSLDVNHMSSNDLATVSGDLDRINRKTQELLDLAQRENFFFWRLALSRLAKNLEHLDSLAETFHLSSSVVFSDYVEKLVASAAPDCGATGESWRDFVATLHD